jgi:hypothetical protein
LIRHPITDVHELELSSLCNLACVYCPHPVLKRDKANMGWEVFERSMLHVQHYVDAGTQTELSLTGIGEAILHPRFGEALSMCREVIGPERRLVVSTNGVAMTAEIAKQFAQAGVMAFVSLHRPEVGAPALMELARAGVWVDKNHAFVDSSIDWAGQVEWSCSAPRHQCGYLTRKWAVIRQNGSVDACCQDAHDLHPIGSVWDTPGTWHTHITPLCASCHLSAPVEFIGEESDVRVA